MKKLANRKEDLNKIELIYATIYLIVGKILDTFVGKGITVLSMFFLLIMFTILLIVFFHQHAYGKDKPLLTALSIYYKSVAYMAVIFIIGNYQGKDPITIIAWIALIIYGVLAYVYGKKYNEMLNAYLYCLLICFARVVLFMSV
jgi:hypothetical protein